MKKIKAGEQAAIIHTQPLAVRTPAAATARQSKPQPQAAPPKVQAVSKASG